MLIFQAVTPGCVESDVLLIKQILVANSTIREFLPKNTEVGLVKTKK
jgi:hypothetical protein